MRVPPAPNSGGVRQEPGEAPVTSAPTPIRTPPLLGAGGTPLRLGTRGSKLALAQSQTVADALRLAHVGLDVEIRILNTRGDATQAENVPLSSFGEKGIFAKELEAALLAGEIDLAVHSMKDLEHTLPDGLVIAAVPPREDPRDALIGSTLDALPFGARVGTGSVRRRALLLSRRPDLTLLEIRGNIDTRLRKWQEGQYDAICLAVAGLNRLGLSEHIAEILDPDWFTPDPGQGALALQMRFKEPSSLWTATDFQHWDAVMLVNHVASFVATRSERDFLREVGGSCHTPVGALANVTDSSVGLAAMVASPNGMTILRHTETCTLQQNRHDREQRLGQVVAQKLRAQGAERLLGGGEGEEAGR